MPPRHLHSLDEEQPLVDSEPTYEQSYDSLTGAAAAVHARANANANAIAQNNNNATKQQKLKGAIQLILVAVIYGTLNVTLRWVYALPNPPSASAISTVRGWLAVLCFVPFIAHKKHTTRSSTSNSNSNQNDNNNLQGAPPRRPLWKVAAELALWNFGAQGLANIGLTLIQSARAAFLTQLSVVMTPVISAACGTRVHRQVWWACGFALAGLVLLSEDDGAGMPRLGLGDVCCLGGAFSWAMYIYRLSAIGDSQYHEVDLQSLKNFFLASLYTIWWAVQTMATGESQWLGWANLVAWALLFYSALGPGTVADLMQQKAQAVVAATVSNVLLSTEPVFTAIFGRMLLGEETSWLEKLGGCLILIAATIATQEETSEGGSAN